MKIALLDEAACTDARDHLSFLLLDVLASGPSLGFWPSLNVDGAHRYWRDVGRGIADGTRLLVTATDGGRLLGAAQLSLCRPPDGDCAEVRSLLVHSGARRRGIGGVLVRALEAEALAHGRDRVFLDARDGSPASELYAGLGYERAADGIRYRKTLLVPEIA